MRQRLVALGQGQARAQAQGQALEDAQKKPESLKILDKLVDLTKKKGDCNFQETLFRTRMHMYKDNNGVLGNIKKETETGEDKGGYKALFVV